MKPHHKSEMLPYTGGTTVTFRAYVGDQFKDTDLDVQSVLARHYEEKETPARLLDFSAHFCLFRAPDLRNFSRRPGLMATLFETYTGNFACSTADFFKWFFAAEVEAAILLDLEQEYKTELGEKGDAEAEDRNDYLNCI